MSEARSCLRIGEDAAGVVVDVGGDNPRPDYCQDQQGTAFPAFQKYHARISQTYRWSRLRCRRLDRINVFRESEQTKSARRVNKDRNSRLDGNAARYERDRCKMASVFEGEREVSGEESFYGAGESYRASVF